MRIFRTFLNFYIQFLHSIFADLTNPAENRIQFFDFQYFCLTFAFNFCEPGPALEVYLVVTWSKIHSIFRVSLCLAPWFARLVSDSEGSKSQKTVQFPADQVFARCLPGLVLVFPGKKKWERLQSLPIVKSNLTTMFYHEEGTTPLL